MGAQTDRARLNAPERSRFFIPLLLIGTGVMGFGVYGLIDNANRTHPDQWIRWFLGAAFVHDLLVAPALIGLGRLAAARLPGRYRAPVQSAMVISAIVTAVTLPFLLGLGRREDNPTLLPNDYGRGLILVLGPVWAVALLVPLRWRRETRPSDRQPAEGDGMEGKSKLEKYLRDNKVPHQFHHHPEAFTAQEVAAAEHIPGRILAKVVIVAAGDDKAMVVVPAPEQIDLTKVAGAVGASEARIASEEEFRSLFPDSDTGAMPPFGNGTMYDLPVYVDDALAQQDEIVFDACTHTDTVHMAYRDFERLVQPSVVDVT